MTPRIFISYSSKDSDTARYLHDELIKRGADVFIDYRSLDVGDIFPERLAKEIKSCDAVLFLISKDSIESPWVRAEIVFAFRNRKPIVPLTLDGSELPEALFFLDVIHRIPFDGTGDTIARLGRALGIEEAKDPSPPAPSPTQAGRGETTAPPVPRIKSATSLELMPQPFAWIDIPGTIGKKWAGEPYQIAKYPITNAQYRVFVNVGGYDQRKWWTAQGWEYRQQNQWTGPRYEEDPDFNGADQPVVGVSWFEAIAFCLWLSDVTGEKIMLPTEEQWQYAAQGDDKREYPWGNIWETGRCNSDVSGKGVSKTTPVHQYEGKGDSPFKVVDMAGNVLEWCATDYESKSNNINIKVEYRVLRGGSRVNSNSYLLRAANRSGSSPDNSGGSFGFRCARSS